MGTEVDSIPVEATEDLSAAQYHAIQIGGTLATTGVNAVGILQNNPASGKDATAGYARRSRYRAGAAVAAGAQLTVANSGWHITVTSGLNVIGMAMGAVSSGGIGEGIFNFANGLLIA